MVAHNWHIPSRLVAWFVEAGELLVRALEPGETPSAWALSNAICDGLSDLRLCGLEDPDTRTRIAVAAALAGHLVPAKKTATDQAIARLRGVGMGSPGRMRDPQWLASRILLALIADDADDAVRCLEILDAPYAGSLHDLVVSRLQGHGRDREQACADHVALMAAHCPSLRALTLVFRDTPLPRPRSRTATRIRTPWPAPRPWPETLSMAT
jgi:hypothetical protein